MTSKENVQRTPRFLPPVDIIEGADFVTLFAEMPGVDEEHASVTLESDVLTLEGVVQRDERPGYKLVGSEYEAGDYRRAFSLSNAIDRDHIEASVKDGVLRVTLKKTQESASRKIAVKSA